MGITALQGPLDMTGDWLRFGAFMRGKGERKRIEAREEKKLSMMEEELGMRKRKAVADEQLGEVKRKIEASKALMTSAQASHALLQYGLLKKDLNSKDPARVLRAENQLRGFDESKALRDQVAMQDANMRALTLQSRQTMNELQMTKFKYQQDMDDFKMLFNLTLGSASPDVKEALGDEAFGRMQQKVLKQAAGEKLEATPHDYGVMAIVKKPRDMLNFKTAHQYWQHGNIDDEPMWMDWSSELSQLGYTFNRESGKITRVSSEGEIGIENAMIEELGKPAKTAKPSK